MKYQLNVNRERRAVDAEPDTPLLWVLRDELGLTGTKYGCGVAQCGACTVHIGGSPVRSCVLPISHVGDRDVVTIEGLEGAAAAAVQAEWRALDVPQCGFCQSGQIMTSAALLSEVAEPSDEQIDGALNGNVCRCATYPRIREAVHRAARSLDGAGVTQAPKKAAKKAGESHG